MVCKGCRERKWKTHCCFCGRPKEQPPFNAKPGDYEWTVWGEKIVCWVCMKKRDIKQKVK